MTQEIVDAVRDIEREKGIAFELMTELPWNPDTAAPKFNPLGKIPVLVLDNGRVVHDSKVIVERYVAGARELECGVLGNHEPIVFEPGEVRSHHEWYDYESKYVPGLADVHPRAQVEPALAERLMQLALAAYRAVDCVGMARVDFLVPGDALFISEMNTLPGFTATSMYPKQAELAGLSISKLIGRLIELGMASAREGRTPSSGAGDEGQA